MAQRLAAFALAGAVLLLAIPAHAIDELAAKERIGVRIGPVMTRDELHDAFGDGWDATLFFSEAITHHFVLDIRLGATYLGEALNPELDDEITGNPGITSSIQNFYFSAGPMIGIPLGGSNTAYVSLGLGVYSVSVKFQNAIESFDFSDQHLGVNGGFGFSRRIATSWSAEVNGTVHWFAVDKKPSDLYYAFTDGASNPIIVGIALGVSLDLR